MKKKIKPEDLRINLKVIADMLDAEVNGDRDTYSEQLGTGSLCVSIAVCMPTEKECNVSKSTAQLCCDTSNKCEFITKGCASNDYCYVTDPMCAEQTVGCGVYPSVPDCVQSDDCGPMEPGPSIADC